MENLEKASDESGVSRLYLLLCMLGGSQINNITANGFKHFLNRLVLLEARGSIPSRAAYTLPGNFQVNDGISPIA